jgi:glucose-1-phosphate thymidylyltransferase
MACIEEIAYSMGYISRDQLKALGREMAKNEYGQYLIRMSEEE